MSWKKVLQEDAREQFERAATEPDPQMAKVWERSGEIRISKIIQMDEEN